MAENIQEEKDVCVILWKIQNVSHCWLMKKERISSPTFIVDALKSTRWSLWLFPVGTYFDTHVEIRLHREQNCRGPQAIQVNYKLAFLHKDGSLLQETHYNQTFNKDYFSLSLGENRRKVFVTDTEVFLPDDTLTVQCTVWIGNESLEQSKQLPIKPEEIFARTVLKVKRKSFIWRIDQFSSLNPDVKNTLKNDFMEFDFVLSPGVDFQEKLVIDGISFHKNIKYFLLKISIMNSEGQKEYYCSHECFEDDIKKGVSLTILSTRMLMGNKRRYLPNDILSLDIEYLYSTGTISDEFCSHGKPPLVVLGKKGDACVVKEEYQHSTALSNDLKSLFADGSFSDTELRTSTKSFPAHKAILIARSPVFKKMFSNDMKENISGHVEIDDLEDNIVHQMLLYLYTDSLEDLHLENACKLYVAADKYEILSLKSRCSSFLIDNLCPKEVYDILLLADLHQDNDLKKAVQDYILKTDKEVLGSHEWKQFMDTNPKLAVEVMYRKIFPGQD